MEKDLEAVRPPSGNIPTAEADVEPPGIASDIDPPVLPTWRLVCLCIR